MAAQLREPLQSYCATELQRWSVLEIFMYYVYTPVSLLRPLCSLIAHHTL